MAPEVSPKAIEVLDRLARQQSSRSLFRRVPQIDLPTAGEVVQALAQRGGVAELGTNETDGRVHADSDRQDAVSSGAERVAVVRRELHGRPRWRPPQRMRWLLLVLVAAVLVATVVLQRRPPPVEQRLPMASAEAAAEPGSETSATSGPDTDTPSADGPSEDPGTGGSKSNGQGPVFVHVAGAVAAPGVVQLGPNSRVVDAVRAAGGLRADADPDRVNLAAPIGDGQRVVVPVVGQPPPAEVPLSAAPGGSSVSTDGAVDGSQVASIDVNTASATELEELPGVGPATASAIISHRESNGPFSSVDSLLDVRGIGDAKLEAMRDMVVVSGSR